MRASLLPLLRFLCVACLGCSPTHERPLAGASDVWRPNGTERPAAIATKPPGPVWPEYGALRALRPLNAEPFASQGHSPAVEVDIVANAAGAAAYQALVTDSVLPDGTLLGELPRDASAHGLVMQKHADGWSYLELDGQGRVLAEGHLARCEGCHYLAPADHAFGLPRPAPAPAATPHAPKTDGKPPE